MDILSDILRSSPISSRKYYYNMDFAINLPSRVDSLAAGINASIGWIILNQPNRKNAINAQMWKAIPDLVARLDNHRDVRTIVLRGAGSDCFSAGADITEFTGNRSSLDAARQYEQLNVDAMQSIVSAEKPVIAMINGICFGGGLALAIACDLRLASDNATFCLPPARLGLAYPIEGLRQLLSLVSPPIAKQMLFTAKRLNALEAMRCGLVNEIVSPDMLKDATIDLCNTISTNAPLTISACKHTINELHYNPQNPDMEMLQQLSTRCFESLDYKEGRTAFLEKRQPVFKGK